MPALTRTDVGEIVRKFNETYQPKGVCAATPRRMKRLVDELEEYTDEVQWARNKYKALGIASIALGPGAIAVSELLGGGDVDVGQWRRDMANWQYRLAEYQRILDAVPASMMDTPEGCREIYPLVTAPLLDGIWYQVMPGVVLSDAEKQTMAQGVSHCPAGEETCTDIAYRDPDTGDHPPGHSRPKVPDAISPFTLGNQIIVYQDFQKENLEALLGYLRESFNDVVNPKGWPWWVKAAIVTAAGVAVGIAGLYVYNLLPSGPKKRNPSKRRGVTDARRRKAKGLLEEAAPFREYGDSYNRAIDASSTWLESALQQGRVSEVETASKELRSRLDAGGDAG